MNATATSPAPDSSTNVVVRHKAALDMAVIVVLVAAGWSTWSAPGWIRMWGLAAAEFMALKLLTLRDGFGTISRWHVVAYIGLWPGMNARTFLRGCTVPIERPAPGELGAAAAKLMLGLGLLGWAVMNVNHHAPLLIGWVGMLGIIFTLHFGLLHVISWTWRRAGLVAPPIMRAPLASTSLAELWGHRWNVAFAESARRLVVRPIARRWGAGAAGLTVFVLSGLLHETVISYPARGGWGGPTLYFLLQAAGVSAEKSRVGSSLGLGRGVCGWLWTFTVAAAPLPLLFHEPFVGNVIVPFFRMLLGAFIP